MPTRELALDRRVVDAGVNFEKDIAGAEAPPWGALWDAADPRTADSGALADEPQPVSAHGVGSIGSGGQALSWSIPLEVAVEVRSRPPTAVGVPAADAPVEALVEPFRDEDFSGRTGYDDQFLGTPVPLPTVLDESRVSHLDDGSHVLPYEHFSVVVDKNRRLADVPTHVVNG